MATQATMDMPPELVSFLSSINVRVTGRIQRSLTDTGTKGWNLQTPSIIGFERSSEKVYEFIAEKNLPIIVQVLDREIPSRRICLLKKDC